MGSEFDCIAIPNELLKFKKTFNDKNINDVLEYGFGVKVVKNSVGEIERTDYYSDTGELIKSIYYRGSSISVIKHYRNARLYAEEHWSEGKIISKGMYDKSGNIISGIAYKYNRKNKIVSIEKSFSGNYYLVEYDYDDLDRVCYRGISLNRNKINEQKYKFDILDRISEYEDYNQKICVLKISQKNELLHYKITDKMSNEILVKNYFEFGKYIRTEILLNGHSTTVKDQSYVDNIMLKKPYTTEDDLDLIIANLFKTQECTTKRVHNTDILDNCIDSNIQNRVLPISIRKRVLYYQVVNF